MSNGETDVEKRIRIVENFCSARSTQYITMLEVQEDHEKRMRDIEKLVPALRAVMWVGTAIGLSIVMFIWSVITGQVNLQFP